MINLLLGETFTPSHVSAGQIRTEQIQPVFPFFFYFDLHLVAFRDRRHDALNSLVHLGVDSTTIILVLTTLDTAHHDLDATARPDVRRLPFRLKHRCAQDQKLAHKQLTVCETFLMKYPLV